MEAGVAGAQVVVPGSVEQVVHPVAQDLRPEVSDAALGKEGEVFGIVEQGAGAGNVPLDEGQQAEVAQGRRRATDAPRTRP